MTSVKQKKRLAYPTANAMLTWTASWCHSSLHQLHQLLRYEAPKLPVYMYSRTMNNPPAPHQLTPTRNQTTRPRLYSRQHQRDPSPPPDSMYLYVHSPNPLALRPGLRAVATAWRSIPKQQARCLAPPSSHPRLQAREENKHGNTSPSSPKTNSVAG